MKKKIILIIILIIAVNFAWSQSKHITFKRLTIDDGLSLSSVYCIHQDNKGFMWFGTEDGLNRYDGKNFKIYRPDSQNSNSISHKWPDQIYEDKSGILWFGSRGGLTRFDPKKEIFTQYKSSSAISNKITNDTIICILEDNNNQLWVGTLNGINRIDLESKNNTRLILPIKAIPGSSIQINDIVIDKTGNVWIGTNIGLIVYNYESKNFNKIDLGITNKNLRILSMVFEGEKLWIGTNNGLIGYYPGTKSINHYIIPESILNVNTNQVIENIYLDSKQRLWIGQVHGLYNFKQTEKAFKLYVPAPDVSNSQSINPIKPIMEDNYGNIWYGTFGTGLYKIDTNDFVSNYFNNPGDQKSLSANAIHSIYEDRAGVLWFGSFGAGINIYSPQSHKFDLITNNPNDINSISSNFVWSILEANDGSVWIGTNQNGISRFLPKTETFVHYIYNPADVTSLSNPTVRYMFQDSKGNIWIATDGGGLNKFISETGKFMHYVFSEYDTNTISNNYIRGIYEDKDGFLWIGTQHGLNRFDPVTEKFKRFLNSQNKKNSISHNYIYTGICQDKNGNLWIGTIGGGLNKMDIHKGTFKSYLNNLNDIESLSDNMLFWIYEDKNGFLWIGSNSGLNRFDPLTEKFKRFGIKEGLQSEVVYGILPDEENNIWLSTNYGLTQFNISSFKTRNFDINDGLQSNEFNGGALHLGKSGNMYFGGVYGLNSFNPKKLNSSENKSEIAITKFEIFGKEVKVMEPDQVKHTKNKKNKIFEYEGHYYFHESISYTKEIVLDYSNNFFSLEFSALNNPFSYKVQYAYKMENLDKDWNYSGNRNYVSYVRLKPGKYLFKVKAKNPDDIWSRTTAEISIHILPPFWQTWWFILLEVFIAFNLFMLIYRYLLKTRTNKLLKTQNEKIISVNKQLTESELSLKELNNTKDKFFSIISHDLKNPFSSLLSLSESIKEEFHHLDDEDKLTIFNKIHDSASQIYNLLNNLLTWSSSQRDRISFEPVEFNLSKLIDININLHRSAAENKGINLISNIPECSMAYADREMINTVLRNLISNAVKFSSKGSSIEIETKKENSFIEVKIKDQGTGISEEDLQKLFRIDVKFKSTGTSGEKGTGLGLILCKEFVEKNKGQIKVESILKKGSVFSFSLPLSSN